MLDWITKIYVINLERDKVRWEKCRSQLENYGIRHERFDAINGKNIPPELEDWVDPFCKTILCSKGMQGCGLSHLKILNQMVEMNLDTVLVLEDDFIWTPESTAKIDSLKHFRDGIVKLSCIGPFCAENVNEPVVSNFGLGTGAYLVRLEHAKEMIKAMRNKVYYHIDMQLILTSKIHSIPIYEFPCVMIDGMNDSTIGSSKNTLLSRYLPISETWKWYMKEPFMAPLGVEINLFLVLSLVILIIGIVWRKYWWGKVLLIIGVLDLLFY